MNRNIDFLGKRHIAAVVSAILLVSSVTVISTRGLNYGIDFVGGTELVVKTSTDATIADIRRVVEDLALGDALIQSFGDPEAKEFLIRLEGEGSAGETMEEETSASVRIRAESRTAAYQDEGATDPAPQAADPTDADESVATGEEDGAADAAEEGMAPARPALQDPEGDGPAEAPSTADVPRTRVGGASMSVGARVMEALREELDTSRQEGRFDLNAVQVPALADYLASLAGDEEEAEAIASRIVQYRRETAGGILSEWEALDRIEGIPPETRPYLEERAYLGGFVQLKAEVVGPTIGQELRWKALLAIFWSLLGILAYVWLRFELRFSVASIIALVHDVIIVVGVLALLGEEFSLPMIAALLTIVGYSLNDTIVVFDRVRENLRVHRGAEEIETINTSINQTLSRTLLTSGTTLLVVLALLLLGGPVIHGFAVALFLGVLVGTYSSIYVASPSVLLWRRLAAEK